MLNPFPFKSVFFSCHVEYVEYVECLELTPPPRKKGPDSSQNIQHIQHDS